MVAKNFISRGEDLAQSFASLDLMSKDGINCIHVGNLPWVIEALVLEERLLDLSLTWGNVVGILVARFSETSKARKAVGKFHKGYAFIEFKELQQAVDASVGLTGVELFGNSLKSIPCHLPERLSGLLRVPDAAPIDVEREAALAAKAELLLKKKEERVEMRKQDVRRKERRRASLLSLLDALPPPGGKDADQQVLPLTSLGAADEVIDWDALPLECDPARWKGPTPKQTSDSRNTKKRWQVESFVVLLSRLLRNPEVPLRLVDFGCGSGNLLLPLAALFPHCHFVGVDMKPGAVALVISRAEGAGLNNVSGVTSMAEAYREPFDIALGLHACGNATDYAMLAASQHRAAYVMCPCCVGKLKFSLAGGSSFHANHSVYTPRMPGVPYFHNMAPEAPKEEGNSLTHPRSKWMRDSLPDPATTFGAIAKTGDISHGCGEDDLQVHSHVDLARMCKLHLELDRNEAAKEDGYSTAIFHLLHSNATAKSEILVGIPSERPEWMGDLGVQQMFTACTVSQK